MKDTITFDIHNLFDCLDADEMANLVVKSLESMSGNNEKIKGDDLAKIACDLDHVSNGELMGALLADNPPDILIGKICHLVTKCLDGGKGWGVSDSNSLIKRLLLVMTNNANDRPYFIMILRDLIAGAGGFRASYLLSLAETIKKVLASEAKSLEHWNPDLKKYIEIFGTDDPEAPKPHFARAVNRAEAMLMVGGEKIEAVKLIKKRIGCNLKTASALIDDWWEDKKGLPAEHLRDHLAKM